MLDYVRECARAHINNKIIYIFKKFKIPFSFIFLII